ncbi:MAG TPA: hypothetical protein VHE35_32220 [Kofleriaceae bacterium]|nr:hypothetical protein [Kofleriaceae bacterium]
MSVDTLIEQHRRGGAGECKQKGAGDGIATVNRNAFKDLLDDLVRKKSDTPPWDCTLLFQTRDADRNLTFAHFEHVESATTRGGTTTITTTNGLDQGNQSTTVPASPGSNTWTATPGGSPPMSLSGSTSANADLYRRTVPPVGNVTLVCCR